MMENTLSQIVESKIIKEVKSDMKSMATRCYDVTLYHDKEGNFFVKYIYHIFTGKSGGRERRWICFDADGVRTNCDPEYNTVTEHNNWLKSMTEIKKLDLC